MKDFPSFYNQGLRNFVSYLLVIEPKDRPSFMKSENIQLLMKSDKLKRKSENCWTNNKLRDNQRFKIKKKRKSVVNSSHKEKKSITRNK